MLPCAVHPLQVAGSSSGRRLQPPGICFIRKVKTTVDDSEVLSGPQGFGEGSKKQMLRERSDVQSLRATNSSQGAVTAGRAGAAA